MFLLISIYLFTMLIWGKYPSAHAFCPYAPVCFGLLKLSVAAKALLMFTGAVIFGLLVCLSTLLWGRKFCSYICPFGTGQEFLYRLRSRKYRLNKRIPFFYEYKFRRLKYLVLAATAILVVTGLSYVYMKFCPVLTLAGLHCTGGNSSFRFIWQGSLILIIILFGGLLSELFWGRFLCPMAALMNLFQYLGNLIGLKRLLIYRNMESCIDCYMCNQNCPMNLDIQGKEYITDVNCTHCLKCTEVCTKPGTLQDKRVSKKSYI